MGGHSTDRNKVGGVHSLVIPFPFQDKTQLANQAFVLNVTTKDENRPCSTCYMINPFRGHGGFRVCFELEVNSATVVLLFASCLSVVSTSLTDIW